MIDAYKKNRPCPKCRTLGVTTSYCEKESNEYVVQQCWVDAAYAPHMHRDCINCGHVFYERPADSDDKLYTQVAIDARKASHRLRMEQWTAEVFNNWKPRFVATGIEDEPTVEGVRAGRSWWKP